MISNFPVHLLVNVNKCSYSKSKDEIIKDLKDENAKLKDDIFTLKANKFISIFNFVSMLIAFVLCIVCIIFF